MIRAIIDTNVLVSGLISPAGNEALIVLAIHQGFVRPCLSEAIIAEYAAVLAHPKFAFPPEEIEALLAMLQSKGEIRLLLRGSERRRPMLMVAPSATRILTAVLH